MAAGFGRQFCVVFIDPYQIGRHPPNLTTVMPCRSIGFAFWMGASVLACASLMAVTGCQVRSGGPATAHLQGKVTIAGQLIPADAQASITFKPTGSGQAHSTSALIANSTY